ncbi:MAG: hypothetical protein P8M30_02330 [Planctomycetaceae bacterium]|nr:hypothetical protein [bacterium]MDB4679500.1 hypothetical protein [Planctomycetaceae bacterium]MDG2388135.1 hypothetical protein [Planctomycetaceae bacterium]
MTSSSETKEPVFISGKLVVVGMFAFAIMMTGCMWFYWKLNLAPFLPLQQAIIATEELAESRPVVEGGRAKGQENAPNTLRVTMKIDYDPVENVDRVIVIEQKILELAKTSLPHYEEFDQLEFNLYWPKQETELKPIAIQRITQLK